MPPIGKLDARRYSCTLTMDSTWVPLIVRVPGGLRGVRRTQLVELVDVLPTLLSLWGVPASKLPADLDGHSLLPLLGISEIETSAYSGSSAWIRNANLSGAAEPEVWSMAAMGGGTTAVHLAAHHGNTASTGAAMADAQDDLRSFFQRARIPASYQPRRYVRSVMRHPMRLAGQQDLPLGMSMGAEGEGGTHSSEARHLGEQTQRGTAVHVWVCGEQHSLRTQRYALSTFFLNGSVVNGTLFDLKHDPLEQHNLLSSSQDLWSRSMRRAWRELSDLDRQLWPRSAMVARSTRSLEAGELCGEFYDAADGDADGADDGRPYGPPDGADDSVRDGADNRVGNDGADDGMVDATIASSWPALFALRGAALALLVLTFWRSLVRGVRRWVCSRSIEHAVEAGFFRQRRPAANTVEERHSW